MSSDTAAGRQFNRFESFFLHVMMLVNFGTGVLASLNLTWSVALVHWAWTLLGCATFASLFRSGKRTSIMDSNGVNYFMLCAILITLAEQVSVYTGFHQLQTNCSLEPDAQVSETCIWIAVYQFHSVYLAFVHVMFSVLMNCCVHDFMKERLNSLDLSYYMSWHNYTGIPFPILLSNMYSIYLMQQYMVVFSSIDQWSGYMVAAFSWILLVLAVGNTVFTVAIYVWYSQATKEVVQLEQLLERVPFLSKYTSKNGTCVGDIEATAAVVCEEKP
ncbi:hypothetical protein HDU78_000103 [Chytriomyces hyalinus]|nr:hypothetical protein HDU78_000103 [Chytriomyces hyalinus]